MSTAFSFIVAHVPLNKTNKILGFGAVAAGVLTAAALLWLGSRPPELVRVAANYSAKIVCSNVFLAGRDPGEVLRDDVQAPGLAVLKLMRVSVDRERGLVRAGLLGFIGGGLAAYRPGAGCTVLPDGRVDDRVGAPPARAASASMAAAAPAPVGDALWPEGEAVRSDPAIEQLLHNATLAGPGMRAIVVIHGGRVVGERYAAGFNAATPLLGWSMTKTVTAALIGLLVGDGRLRLEDGAGWPAAPGDGRERIRIADLLAMTSGLRFNEAYGDVSDVVRMLYLESDMAAYARSQPLEHPVGERWSYSSGTSVILADIVQKNLQIRAADFARQRLFDPVGMRSAVMEADPHGTLVGSSYLYATARDWARFALLLLQGGQWQGREILPRAFVAMMSEPVPASGGQYGRGQVWLWGSDAVTPGVNPDKAFGIPADAYWMEGHDGQSIAIVPSRELIVVRLGLTPDRDYYLPQPLLRALLAAVPRS